MLINKKKTNYESRKEIIMKGKKLVRKLLMFFMVFAAMVVAEAATQQKTVYAEAYDYIWCVTRGGCDERAGVNMLCVDKGLLSQEDLYKQCCCNWYSVEKIERMLNLGYMLDYEQQLKDAGWIPNDFVRTPLSTSTSSTSGNNTHATTPSKPTYSQEEIDAAWKESKRVEPTCISDGYVEFKNSLTGDKKKETLAMVEHSYEKSETPSTCAEAGIITYTCSTCAYTYNEELPLAEHTFDEEMVYHLLS